MSLLDKSQEKSKLQVSKEAEGRRESPKDVQEPQNRNSQNSNEETPLPNFLLAAKAAIDKKAENLKVLDLREVSAFTDYFVICSGTSDRQVQAIADFVKHSLADHGSKPIAVEGYSEGRWILIDFGDLVVHIFLDALRDYYDLENLWSDVPRIKVPSEYYGPSAVRVN